MSCGEQRGLAGTDDVDCGRFFEEVDLFLDGEMGPAEVERIRAHIDACAPCLDLVQVERVVKTLVARSCQEHAPEHLRQRVLLRISQLVVEAPRA